MTSNFHQVEKDLKDIQKTAFTVENSNFEFVRMPSQRVMDNNIFGIRKEWYLVYIDDIIIYSLTIEEHISEVLKRLRKANLKIQPSKCEFLWKEWPIEDI